MNEEKYNLKIIFCIGATLLLAMTTFLPLCVSNFTLPSQGGGMVHCDPQLSENIRRPIPTTDDVSVVWYRHDFGGELHGTFGNGIVGNGKIAACTFGPLSILGDEEHPNDNLILYDYYGNRLWSSGWWKKPMDKQNNWSLNPYAFTSTPMVDINNWVVACDNEKIILVDASDLNNIHVKWITNLSQGGIPLSPTIVEDNTIILPTTKCLYAFDVNTGDELANRTFLCTSSDPIYGIREMNWTDFQSLMSNPLNCPYHYNSTGQDIEWTSTVPYGVMPMTSVFFEGTTMFIADRNGNVVAIDTIDGSTLATDSLGTPELITDNERFYSSQNSACVQGNRTYVLTDLSVSGWRITNTSINMSKQNGQLYAVDVDPDAENKSDRLTIAWNYSYSGYSQASPTLINDTLYFDGNNTLFFQNKKPHIYAVYTDGTEKWKVAYDNKTLFSFAKDPRGGFWYEDSDQIASLWNGDTLGNKLVRFYEENGTEMKGQTIDMTKLLNDEQTVIPCSDMVICGTETNPIMLMSANHDWGEEGKWVVAINLSDNNSLIWKVPIDSSYNYAGGLYTILTEDNHSRIL
ncbi:PQQ-like domain protein [uncultured archaeon]|nr:PQQ-like domain protein [uncultured archaeon]